MAISKIEWNQPFISFSLSNISKKMPEYQNLLNIRLEGPIFRLRIAMFNIILVGLCHSPIMASISSLVIEFLYMLYVVIVACRYFYMQSKLILISRINMSLSIIFITALALYLSITQAGKDIESIEISRTLQFVGVFVILFSMLLETLLVVLVNSIKIIAFVRRKTNKALQEVGILKMRTSLIPLIWVRSIKDQVVAAKDKENLILKKNEIFRISEENEGPSVLHVLN